MKESFLIDVLKKGVSPFHCVEAAMQTLEESGFEELEYARPWNLKKGKAYMMNHHGTTLYAFTVGENFRADAMLRMAAAHTDYPYLRIKPNADFVTDRYAQVNVEVYGGPILNTWFDRPLGIAGRVIVRSKDVFAPETMLYRSGRPVLIIPNLAIHMNREVNKGVAINNQVDLMPVADMLPEEQQSTDYFLSFLAEELAVKKEDILDFELNTYCVEEPAYVGIKETLLSSPRLDNQTSVAALLAAIVEGTRTDGINLIALFDNEEIGSRSKQGADSTLLSDIVKRLAAGSQLSLIEDGFYLSVDVAHATHPNYNEKSDITNTVLLGKGAVLKSSASQRYVCDSEAGACIIDLCNTNGIALQRTVNRSGMPGGQTLGPIVSSYLPMRACDIGIPVLAMHSASELMHKDDYTALADLITAFFTSP